jgi:hypothetical protein
VTPSQGACTITCVCHRFNLILKWLTELFCMLAPYVLNRLQPVHRKLTSQSPAVLSPDFFVRAEVTLTRILIVAVPPIISMISFAISAQAQISGTVRSLGGRLRVRCDGSPTLQPRQVWVDSDTQSSCSPNDTVARALTARLCH